MVAVIGIDPGLVHTGLVRIELLPDLRRYWVEHEVVSGINLDLIERWCQRRPADAIFVEAYRPRSRMLLPSYSGSCAPCHLPVSP